MGCREDQIASLARLEEKLQARLAALHTLDRCDPAFATVVELATRVLHLRQQMGQPTSGCLAARFLENR
jgi:hypothetical protein